MKKVNVRLPDALRAEIEAEARKRKLSKAQIVRERLLASVPTPDGTLRSLADIAIPEIDGFRLARPLS